MNMPVYDERPFDKSETAVIHDGQKQLVHDPPEIRGPDGSPAQSVDRGDQVWTWSADEHLTGFAVWREMIWEIYSYRELLGQLVLRDIRIRYKQAIMGFAWALLMPLLIVAAGCLVKIALAHASGGNVDLPRVAGMSIKALGWAFFAGSIGFAANSLVSNMALVTKVYFPRELFPFSAVITQWIDTCVGGGFLLVLLAFFANISISVEWLWAVPVVLLLVAMTTTVALLLSCANVFFRDVKYIVQIVLTFGIFFTPVFYEPELFGPHGSFIMMLNPLSPILEALRLAIIEKHNLLLPVITEGHDGLRFTTWHIGFLIYSAVISLGGFLWAWRYFHKMEFVFAEYV